MGAGGGHPEAGFVGEGEDRGVLGGNFRAEGIPAMIPAGGVEVVAEAVAGGDMDEELAPGRGSDPVTEIPEIGILFATLPELSFLSPVVGILDGLLVVRGEDEGGTGLADAADFGEGATALIAAGDVHEAIEAEDGGIEPVAVKGQASHVGHPESPGGPAGLTQFPGPLHHFRGEVHPNAGGEPRSSRPKAIRPVPQPSSRMCLAELSQWQNTDSSEAQRPSSSVAWA